MSHFHSFHIPVMGIGFTIDAPLKVAHYGIDSVISLVDDSLLERLRKMYCSTNSLPYREITEKTLDFRAERITSYLNMINDLVEKKIDDLVNSVRRKSDKIKEILDAFPNRADIKKEFFNLSSKYINFDDIENWLKENLKPGSIDVNIMTKLDKENYIKKEKLSSEFNDAHAALRGFAKSNLSSSVVFSAGMNPRLYGYITQFDDFFPDENGFIKKKIILKVSDFRSALIQGKFLAKKGLWVSEFRIESGLNCGGHAFATDGYLMGPILAEFRDKRDELLQTLHNIFAAALSAQNRVIPNDMLKTKITAQGGVGNAEEHQFLIEHYKLDSVGWGTPFLLVPEVTNVDNYTRTMLEDADEDDLYLSNISPLGVPFNSLRGNTKDVEKIGLIEKGRPGSSCPKKYLVSNKEFTEKSICSASRQYQNLKLKELNKLILSSEEYEKRKFKITDKSCLCVGVGTSALLVNNLDVRVEGRGVSVCPGPNMAYFSKKMSLKDLIDHIYGRKNLIENSDRPNMFIKEMKIYIDFLKNKIDEAKESASEKQEKFLKNFAHNLNDGINYYNNLFRGVKDFFEDTKENILKELNSGKRKLNNLAEDIESFFQLENAEK